LDILSGLPEIKICTEYDLQGKKIEFPPIGLQSETLEKCIPVYATLPSWQEDITLIRHWKDLPAEARDYIHQLEILSGVHVSLISVGPERDQIIRLD
jgi:adenylosuccinate synthase